MTMIRISVAIFLVELNVAILQPNDPIHRRSFQSVIFHHHWAIKIVCYFVQSTTTFINDANYVSSELCLPEVGVL